MDPVQDLPRLVTEVRRLGAMQLAAFHHLDPADVRWKQEGASESSVVTRWDLETEVALRRFVSADWPQHSFLGEEQGDDRRDPGHYWLLDPIDGTANFVAGIPYWGTSLAYWRDGAMQLGIVHFPALDRTFTALRGGGAWDGAAVLRTPHAEEYSMRSCVGLDSRSHLRYTLRLQTRVRILGSAIANLCFTATGLFVASQTRGKLWDVAAGDLLLREAGAVVESDPDLARIDPATYASDPAAGRITLLARASSELPSLREFLRPVTAD